MTIDLTGHIDEKSLERHHYGLVAVHAGSLDSQGNLADDGAPYQTVILASGYTTPSQRRHQRRLLKHRSIQGKPRQTSRETHNQPF